MKSIIKCGLWISILLLATKYANAQNAQIASMSNFEVGVAQDVTCNFDYQSNPNAVILRYEWSIPFIGNGVGNIQGTIDGQNTSTRTISTSDASNTISVKFGDYYNTSSELIECTVYYKEDANATTEIPSYASDFATIKTICEPTFNKSSYPKCCTKPFSVTADACEGNNFQWTVSNATFIGQGNQTISVTPNAPSNNIQISCTARRTQSVTAYNRSSNLTITRTDPMTPAINYSKTYICKDDNNIFTLPAQCGLIGALWTAPNCNIQGQGTLIANITPNATIATGSQITVSAQGIYTGGCTTPPSSTASLHVLDGTAPPTPSILKLKYVYPNGYYQNNNPTVTFNYLQQSTNYDVTISPAYAFMHDCPYTIDVTICIKNKCTQVQKCRTFSVTIPAYAHKIIYYKCCDPLEDCYDEIYCQRLKKRRVRFPCDSLLLKKNMDGNAENTSSDYLIFDQGQKNVENNLSAKIINKNIEINALEPFAKGKFYLYDIMGRLIQEGALGEGFLSQTIKLHNDKSGIYILRLQNGGQINIFKLYQL